MLYSVVSALAKEYLNEPTVQQFIFSRLWWFFGVVTLLLLGMTQVLIPEERTITGTVNNAFDEEPVAGADVSIGKYETSSLSNGKFRLTFNDYGQDKEIHIAGDDFFDWSDLVSEEMLKTPLDVSLRPKVRVLLWEPLIETEDSQGMDALGTAITSALDQQFTDCDEIEVVLFGTELQQALEALGQPGRFPELYDMNQAVTIGQFIGANRLVLPKIQETSDGFELSAIMMDLRLGTQVESSTKVFAESAPTQIEVKELAASLIAKLTSIAIKEVSGNPSGDWIIDISDRSIAMSGITSCVPAEHVIWVTVVPEGTNKHYPQVRAQIAGRRWNAPSIYIGKDGEYGRIFNVYVILAPPDVNAVFEEYVSRGDTHGLKLTELPITAAQSVRLVESRVD